MCETELSSPDALFFLHTAPPPLPAPRSLGPPTVSAVSSTIVLIDHAITVFGTQVLHTTDPMSANPLFSGPGSGDDPWSHFYEVGSAVRHAAVLVHLFHLTCLTTQRWRSFTDMTLSN